MSVFHTTDELIPLFQPHVYRLNFMTNVDIENSTIEHNGSYCTILCKDSPELDDEFINKIILSDVVEIYSMHEKLVDTLVSSHHFEIVYKVRNRKRWELKRTIPEDY